MYGSWDMVRGRQKRVPHLEITMKKMTISPGTFKIEKNNLLT